MADLFDIKVGGSGWHITSHLIALVALFVACFAITGYITFRDDSVPGTALKDHDVNLDDVTLDSLTFGDGYSYKWYHQVYDQATMNVTRTAGDSLGAVASGFGAGMYVVEAITEVEIATAADMGALDFEITTPALAAYNETGGTGVTAAGLPGATTTVALFSSRCTTNNGFSLTNTSICLVAGGGDACGATGKIRASVLVVARPGVTLP